MESGPNVVMNRLSRVALPALALAVLIVLVFSNSLSVPFLLDDFATIPGNPSITQLWPLTSVLFPPPEVYSAGRPVLNLSFALNYAVSGTSVRGYHVVNIAIHIATALTLFGVLLRSFALPRLRQSLGRAAMPLAFVISLLWAVHPVQTASVTYLSQRAESLMGLFYLLTFYFFLRGAEKLQAGWLVASAATCALGMMTKEVMVTAPVLLLLFDWQFLSGTLRDLWQQRGRFYIGLAATWLLLGALMITSRLDKRAVGMDQGIPWHDYPRIECQAVLHYLKVSFWPSPLVFDFGADLPVPAGLQLIIPALILGALIAISVMGLWRKHPLGFLGCAFFLFLAPTSSVVPVAGQPIADNRIYLPLVVVVTAVAATSYIALTFRSAILAAGAAVGLSWLTHERNKDFQSELAIWSDTAAKQPVNARAWVFLSQELKKAGKREEAVKALATSVRYKPKAAELRNNLAVACYELGRLPEAVEHFKAALQLKPDYADAYYNFGTVLFLHQNFRPALECFQNSIRYNPTSFESHNYAGLCYLQLGNPTLAARHFEQALRLNPQHAVARSNLEEARARIRNLGPPAPR